MKDTWPPFTPTLVGSLPHGDAHQAVRMVADLFPEIPDWPQLPALSPAEGMYAQAAGGFPGVRVDSQGKVTVALDDDALAAADALLSGALDPATLAIRIGEGAGLHALSSLLAGQHPPTGEWYKGQLCGPVSLGLMATGPDGRSILYDPLLKELLVAFLCAKARWLSDAMALQVPSRRPLVFLDEPYLSSFGSAFLPLGREEVTALIRPVVEAVPGPVGIHCCGNTDWSLVMETGVDILNLDAFAYGEGLALYPRELAAFLERGGQIAWGIVPTDKEPEGLDPVALADRVVRLVDRLAEAGVGRDLVTTGGLVTPCCGMETRSLAGAETIACLTAQTAAILRDRLGKEA